MHEAFLKASSEAKYNFRIKVTLEKTLVNFLQNTAIQSFRNRPREYGGMAFWAFVVTQKVKSVHNYGVCVLLRTSVQ